MSTKKVEVQDIPTESKLLSSVDVISDTTLGTSNVYTTIGGGNDGQYQFTNILALEGKTRVGLLNCWDNTKNWTLTTEYKLATGSQVPLYNGLEIEVSWYKSSPPDETVDTAFNPTLNVDGYGSKPVYRDDTYARLNEGEVANKTPYVTLDFKYVSYRAKVVFRYHKEHDVWLIKHYKLGSSGTYIFVTVGGYDQSGGYNRPYNNSTLEQTSISPSVSPYAYSLLGDTHKLTPDTILCAYSGNYAPFLVSTKGQIEKGDIDITNGTNSPYFSITSGVLSDKANSNNSVTVSEGINAYYINPNTSTTGNSSKVTLDFSNYSITGITLGDETLTRRLGLIPLYVI